jgi:predicted enzyme related to lactoylglutathione lyase
VRRIEAEGGSIIKPRTLIPGIGHLVSFKDTEGNVLAILEPVQTPPAGRG